MARHKVEIANVNTANIKVLTNEEMKELSLKMKMGDENARKELIEGNLKLVLSILKKYNNRTDNMDDLFQLGTVGLIKAINNFDLNYDVRFSTYAVFMIEGEIKRYIRDNSQIRISRSVKELSYMIINYKEEYLRENLRYPSNEEICAKFNISEYELYNILNSLCDPVSIFEPIYNDGGDTIYLLDQLEDSKNVNVNDLILLKDSLNRLKDRERTIIVKRYVDGMSQAELASELNISQAQVSRIESSALNSVKKLIL